MDIKTLGVKTASKIKNLFQTQVGLDDLAAAIGYIENAGVPTIVVPDFIGQTLYDTTNKVHYIATDVTTGAWSVSGASKLGYTSGGAVTQATNRTTGVTLNALAGQITTNNASLAAEVAATFVVMDSSVAIGDVVVVSIQSGSNGGNTAVNVTTVAAGSFKLTVSNNNAAAGTAETGAIIVNFAVIKSAAA